MDEITRSGGIYAISRKDRDDRFYIGSSVNFGSRWYRHVQSLRANKHHSRALQNAWNKHGPEMFEFVILEPIDDNSMLIEREQVWLDRFRPAYNICKVAGSSAGVKHSDEARAKMSAARAGVKRGRRSDEIRAKISAAHMGKVISPSQRAKLSAAHKGRRLPMDQRAKMSEARTRYWASVRAMKEQG